MKNASHILLVDDEPLVLSSMRDLLEVDYVVHTAEDGPKALELLSKYPIKVLISDERMPGMRGHQLLKRAKPNCWSKSEHAGPRRRGFC